MMKKLICFLLIVPALAQGQTCPNATLMMQKYKDQASWQKQVITEPGVTGSVAGLVDSGNNLHLLDLTRKQAYEAKVTLGSSRKKRESFFYLCKKYGSLAEMLSSYRQGQAQNPFKVHLRYLPGVQGYANDPYEVLKQGSYSLTIEYADDALVNRAILADQAKREIHQQIQNQLEAQPVGVYELDLTNLDDFVCDLMQGKAILQIYRRMYAPAPIVTKTEVVSKNDVFKLYREWKESTAGAQSREETIFLAGGISAELQENQVVQLPDQNTAWNILQNLLPDNATSLPRLSGEELSCAADRLQKYHQESTAHLINVQFDVVRPPELGVQ